MARLKSEFLHQYHQRHGAAWGQRWLGQIDRVAAWGNRFAPLANWVSNRGAVRWLSEKTLGLDRRRPLPLFARQTFLDQWQASPGPGDIALFADTFSNFFEPEQLKAAVGLATRLGAQVEIAPRVCCGRPLISKGFLNEAARHAEATTRALLPLVQRGLPILFCEPSCYSAVCDEHPLLLRGEAQEQARRVADACRLFEEWAAPTIAGSDLALQAGPRRILVHGHCHQQALTGTSATTALLSAIPDCEVVALDSGCCGMAGLFGYEHYELSRAIGERRLFPAMRDAGPETAVVATGFSCRQQIAHFTHIEAHSPVTLLESLST
jgi:Fe-S oxidoreductase